MHKSHYVRDYLKKRIEARVISRGERNQRAGIQVQFGPVQCTLAVFFREWMGNDSFDGISQSRERSIVGNRARFHRPFSTPRTPPIVTSIPSFVHLPRLQIASLLSSARSLLASSFFRPLPPVSLLRGSLHGEQLLDHGMRQNRVTSLFRLVFFFALISLSINVAYLRDWFVRYSRDYME